MCSYLWQGDRPLPSLTRVSFVAELALLLALAGLEQLVHGLLQATSWLWLSKLGTQNGLFWTEPWTKTCVPIPGGLILAHTHMHLLAAKPGKTKAEWSKSAT